MAGLIVLLAVGALLALAAAADTGVRLLRNYRLAKTIGAPIRIVPISPLNPFWVLLDRKVLPLLRRLPFGDNSFTRYNWRGWEVEDRWRSHYEMGDIWVLVTPFKNWVYVNDPDALMSVFRRGNEITRPVVVTAEGERWKTQRRILTHCFNEANNKIVWSEVITLAGDMLQYWSTKASIRSSADDLRTLSLHVLSRAAFGKSFPFEGADNRDHSATLGTKALAWPWPFRKLRSVYAAWVNFHDYMTGMYEEGKRAAAAGKAADDHNLLSLMVRASQADPQSLTESEIYGNMFAVSFAGHDTTSNTLTFALHFLAAHPGVQDWLTEEAADVFGERGPEEWDYRADFPRLKRCLAVMYETMRLYTPVPVLKWTADRSQPVTVHDRTYLLPPHSMIAPSYGAIQTDPRFWGSDSLAWWPSRWIKKTSSSSNEEEFHMPPRGAFLAWSEGTRDCVGRKFSQVEFVATMAALFRRWRVDLVVSPKETLDAARRRVGRLTKTDSYAVLLLQMLHPERAPLVWRRA
ncbi:uncharacterized protein PG986_011289 [Apiospora aurea]|uniref:Cytochrome P450 n=1 Tax=Apiospora aurea TaxID=335848 RepID=A0ABR1Q4M7_9PEZI